MQFGRSRIPEPHDYHAPERDNARLTLVQKHIMATHCSQIVSLLLNMTFALRRGKFLAKAPDPRTNAGFYGSDGYLEDLRNLAVTVSTEVSESDSLALRLR
jgi:hypothetical protein